MWIDTEDFVWRVYKTSVHYEPQRNLYIILNRACLLARWITWHKEDLQRCLNRNTIAVNYDNVVKVLCIETSLDWGSASAGGRLKTGRNGKALQRSLTHHKCYWFTGSKLQLFRVQTALVDGYTVETGTQQLNRMRCYKHFTSSHA